MERYVWENKSSIIARTYITFCLSSVAKNSWANCDENVVTTYDSNYGFRSNVTILFHPNADVSKHFIK